MKVFGITVGGTTDGAPLELGAHPAVDLLPPEVGLARRSRGIRRGVVAIAVLVIVGVVAGGAGAKVQAIAAEVGLLIEQDRTAALIDRQAEFAGVLAVQAEIEEREAARQVIASTEIDWQSTLAAITGTLPADATLASVAVEGSSPMLAYAQPVVPLQGARVATVTFTVRSPALLSVPGIEDQLASVPGFVDVQVPSSAVDQEGVFETTFIVHLDEGAYSGRYPADPATSDEQAPTDEQPADADAEGEESR